MDELRYAEILIDENKKETVLRNFADIKFNDIFRLFEPDGFALEDGKWLVATKDVYRNEDGILTVSYKYL